MVHSITSDIIFIVEVIMSSFLYILAAKTYMNRCTCGELVKKGNLVIILG